MVKGKFLNGIPEDTNLTFYSVDGMIVYQGGVRDANLNGNGVLYNDSGYKAEEGFYLDNILVGRPCKKYQFGKLVFIGELDGKGKRLSGVFYDWKTGR